MKIQRPVAPPRAATAVLPPKALNLPARSPLFQAWQSFWFTPVPPIGLHALRVLAGLLFIAWLLPFAGDVEAFFGLQGWVDQEGYRQISRLPEGSPVPLGWSLLYAEAIAGNAGPLSVFYWTALGIFALFTLGLATRLTSVLTWIVVVSFLANPATRFDADYLLAILAFYLMVGYLLLGQWSGNLSMAQRLLGSPGDWLWNALRSSRRAIPSHGANVAVRLLQVHFAIIIVAGGLHKLQFPAWWSGVAFWYPLHSPFTLTETTIRSLAESPYRYLFVLSLAQYAMLGWELSFPAFAWRTGWWRVLLLSGGVLACLGSWYVYETPGFGPFCLIGCLSYLRTNEWQWLLRILSPMKRPATALSLGLAVILAASSCAPRDPGGSKGLSSDGQGEDPAGQARATPVKGTPEIPPLLRNRVDAALQQIHSRDLLVEHSFWTVFHGILGVGPETAMIFDSQTGKRVKAIDYVCSGGKLRGLEFVAVGPDRADVVTQPGSGTFQGHQDQFVAEMTQWGLPRDKKFLVQGKEMPFEAFLLYSKDRATVKDKQELSWAILIIGEHYGTNIEWTNNRGEKLKFEDVVRYELDQPIKDSPVCGGTHRLFGLTWALHRHLQKGGKLEGIWKEVAELTRYYVDLAKKLQNKDGSFSTEYLRGPGNNQTDLTLRIHSTGHVLEWLALALSDKEINEPWMEDAASVLATLILRHSNQGLDGGAVYHATHGLEIYRNRVFGPTPHPPVIPPYPR